jgi:hypothetical protein
MPDKPIVPGDFIWVGRFRNRPAIVTDISKDDKGTLKYTYEPVPKGRKKPKTRNLLPYRVMTQEDAAKHKALYDEETEKIRAKAKEKKSASMTTPAARVAHRFAMEHSSPDAKKKYLQEHPKADPGKHTVKDTSAGGTPKVKDSPHSFRDKASDHAKAGRHDKAFEQFSVAAEAFKQRGDHAAAKSMEQAAREQAKLWDKAQKKKT